MMNERLKPSGACVRVCVRAGSHVICVVHVMFVWAQGTRIYNSMQTSMTLSRFGR
jgi:hypothetical protein